MSSTYHYKTYQRGMFCYSKCMILSLLAHGNRVLRPQDAAGLYAEPSKEFARLADAGVLLRLSHGYYAVVPEERRSAAWRPTIEGVALGMAIADYSTDAVALMGVSAARVLGWVPRAMAGAVVGVPKQRPARQTPVGPITFVMRDVGRLEVQVVDTDLVRGFATTAEQTALDIAHRPGRGGVSPAMAVETLTVLAEHLDWDVVADLTTRQRKHSAAARLAWIASAVVDPPSLPRSRKPVSSLGLRPRGTRPAADFGVVE